MRCFGVFEAHFLIKTFLIKKTCNIQKKYRDGNFEKIDDFSKFVVLEFSENQ